MRARVSLCVTVVLMTVLAGLLYILTFMQVGSLEPKTGWVDFEKTPFLFGYAYTGFKLLVEYLWLCFGLSFIAAYYFWSRCRGKKARVAFLVYVASKGLLTVLVASVAGALIVLRARGPIDDVLVFKSGESALLGIETMSLPVLFVGEILLSMPLWLMLLAALSQRLFGKRE